MEITYRIPYKDLPKTSSYKITKFLLQNGYTKKEINDYSFHKLKQLYNRLHCNKYNRLFNN
jgi:hypothetical protein